MGIRIFSWFFAMKRKTRQSSWLTVHCFPDSCRLTQIMSADTSFAAALSTSPVKDEQANQHRDNIFFFSKQHA